MEERKFVGVRKSEFAMKEFIKRSFGKGKISNVRVEYTPVGESIIVSTHRPGLVIGKRGERIAELTEILKKRFKMENPHVDIDEIMEPDFDAQLVADEIAMSLERFGAGRYKAVGYKMLERIKRAGALGAEIRIAGKIPSDRARSARFAFGFLKKTGNDSKIVNYAEATAKDKKGVVGIKVSILPKDAKVHDKFKVDEEMINAIKKNAAFEEEVVEDELLALDKSKHKKTRGESELKPKKKVRKKAVKKVKEKVKVVEVKEEKQDGKEE